MRMCFFFFQAEDGIRDLTVTGVQTCALPISGQPAGQVGGEAELGGRLAAGAQAVVEVVVVGDHVHPRGPAPIVEVADVRGDHEDRKSTRLNSSHSQISYAVFCLKKKKKKTCPRSSYSSFSSFWLISSSNSDSLFSFPIVS